MTQFAHEPMADTTTTSAGNIHTCHVLPRAALPSSLRALLPRKARICFVQEPERTATGLVRTKMGVSPQKLHLVYLDEQESSELAQAIRQSGAAPSARYLPASVLPEEFRQAVCPDISVPTCFQESDCCPLPDDAERAERALLSTLEQQPLAGCIAVMKTGNTSGTLQEVRVAVFAERLTGYRSGPVYTLWLEEPCVEQSLPISRDLAHLDSLALRARVHAHVIQQGAALPVLEQMDMDCSSDDEEPLELVPLNEPVFLTKAIVQRANHSTAALLEEVHQDFEGRRGSRIERIKTLLKAARKWYLALPREQRAPMMILHPVAVTRVIEVPGLPGYNRKIIAEVIGYDLIVGIPARLVEPGDPVARPAPKPVFPVPPPIEIVRRPNYVLAA